MSELILGIETSCDETAASVVDCGRTILSNIIYSQIDIHKKYGGVVPEIASRSHVDAISEVVSEALKTACVSQNELSAIAVTAGPGLVGALLVGVSFAKAFAYGLRCPLVPVHHIEGHICANYISSDLEPPFMCLVASGGHTHVVYVSDYADFSVLAKTRDDAAGEAFDKVARAIGLSYPGGVEIERLAKDGNPRAYLFPQAMKNETDFSFSGLKSAVLNLLNSAEMSKTTINRADLAASFQNAVVTSLVTKTMAQVSDKGAKKLAVSGGVAANGELRRQMKAACESSGIEFFCPTPALCTDNAAMIASRGYFSYKKGAFAQLDLNAYPNAQIGDW